MYSVDTTPSIDRKLKKLAKRDRKQYEAVFKKTAEILENPQHYKNLRPPLEAWKRVHIGNFVLTFSVDEKTKTVTLEDYDHHDRIYKSR
ncbi:Uncharacterised protein [Candidatus Norongarragalina meridionalis]|nr:Uncharacterised protein [Candidatus Norongarragalina meridionalis]